LYFDIADFHIKWNCYYEGVEKYLFEYLNTEFINGLEFTTDFSDIQAEINVDISSYKSPLPYLEYISILRKLAGCLPEYNAFVLHSACFDVDGVGVAFSAHSGTGKTTHMRLWQELLGDKMVVVNGDKPIVRFFEDEPETPYAYGTPWNGKEKLGCNMRTKLKHICFIERSEKNYVEPIGKADVIDRIFNQVYQPRDPMAVINTMKLIDRLLSCCNLWIIHCNMEKEAAEIAYKSIFEKM
jgi:hypothetical protein